MAARAAEIPLLSILNVHGLQQNSQKDAMSGRINDIELLAGAELQESSLQRQVSLRPLLMQGICPSLSLWYPFRLKFSTFCSTTF